MFGYNVAFHILLYLFLRCYCVIYDGRTRPLCTYLFSGRAWPVGESDMETHQITHAYNSTSYYFDSILISLWIITIRWLNLYFECFEIIILFLSIFFLMVFSCRMKLGEIKCNQNFDIIDLRLFDKGYFNSLILQEFNFIIAIY